MDIMYNIACGSADSKGYERHEERLLHASRFCQAVFGVKPSLSLSEGDARKLTNPHSHRARLTLTFAQSRDGKIAGEGKRMLALSNAESMIMTHTVRILHDAILVGVGTACNDNPQLNARLLSPLLDGEKVQLAWLPRPVILDPTLRLPPDCRLLQNYAMGLGKQPLVIGSTSRENDREARLKRAGAQVTLMETDKNLRMPWPELLQHLKSVHSIESIMVEGGANVIDDLLATDDQQAVIDDLVVTIAPCEVGASGVGYSHKLPSNVGQDERSALHSIRLKKFSSHDFKNDKVVVWHYS